jgi:hypothetical protein
VTHALQSSSFGFAVPSDAWVRGVELAVRRGSSTGNFVQDAMVHLRLAAQTLPSNKALPGLWPAALTTATYGSATDLWGQLVVVPSDVNAASFGADFVAKYGAVSGNDTANVDSVQVSVTYCAHP